MSVYRAEQERVMAGLLGSGSELDRKYWLALAMYAVLAGVVWWTMSPDKVNVFGRPVEMRMVPLIVIAGLALRTVLAREAEKIRRGGPRD
jgi:hypothetical protein